MKITYNILFLTLLLVFQACKPASKKVVVTDTNSFTKLISAESNVGFDLDENEIDPLAERFITLTIKNNSIADLRNLYLTLEDGQSFLRFKAAGDGTRKSPGSGGTCRELLAPDETCTFELSFTPLKKGDLNIAATVHYTNLINPDSATFYFKALIGSPAELVFSNNITSYNLGNIEQTDTTVRTLDVEVLNTGELSARNIVATAINIDSDPAYSILNNDCPARLKQNKTCKIRLGYRPVNNADTDLPKIFLGTMLIDYWKNPLEEPGKLAANFSFNAFRIEADFTPPSVAMFSFSGLTVGNFDEKSITVANIGYRSGRLEALVLSNNVTCTKVGNQVELVCTLPPNLNNTNFNYRFFDPNNCFLNGREINGINNNQISGTCTFQVRFWPSSTLTTNGFNNGFNIGLGYDSQWKGVWGVTRKLVDIATVSPTNYSSPGILRIVNSDIQPPNLPLMGPYDPITDLDNEKIFMYDPVSYFEANSPNASIYYRFKYTLRNEGNSSINVASIADGSSNGLRINPANNSGNLNSKYYYAFTQAGCATILPGQSCSFSYNFIPKDTGNSQTNLNNTFDELTPFNQKVFNITYSNGMSVDDSGVAIPTRINVIRKRIDVNALGILQINSGSVNEALIAGNTSTKVITVANIGNGPLLIRRSDNLAFNLPLDDASLNGNPLLSGITKNTFSMRIFDDTASSKCGYYSGADKTLNPGQTCTLKMEIKHPVDVRSNQSNAKQPYKLGVSTSFPNPLTTLSTIQKYKIKYVANPSDATLIVKDSNEVKYNVNFNSEGEMVPVLVSPLISAIVYRSPYSAPVVPGSGYPLTTSNFPVQNMPGIFWDNQSYAHYFVNPTALSDTTMPIRNINGVGTDFPKSASYNATDYMSYSNKIHKAMNSMIHLKNRLINNQISISSDVAANNPEDDGNYGRYIIHGGTVPVGVTLPITVQFHNFGSRSNSKISVTADTNVAPFSMLNSMATSLASGTNSGILKVSFTPTTTGIFQRCYNIKFNSGLRNRVTRICVYAEAVSVTYNLSSIQSGQTVEDYKNRPFLILAEEDNGFRNITSAINTTDDSKYSSFSVIKDSLVVITKRFKFKNNSNLTINKLNTVIMTDKTKTYTTYTADETAYPSIKIFRSGFTKSNSSNPYCSANLTLNPGEECEMQITYDPTGRGTEELYYYLAGTYELQTNQYVYQSAGLRFKNSEPAGLGIFNTTFSTTLSAPAIAVGYYNPVSKVKTTINNSYSISINSNPAEKERTAYYLGNSDAFNTFSIRIENQTELRATFLSQWVKYKLYTGTQANFNNYYNSLTDASFSTFPATDYIEIYKDNINSMRIEANRYCFFGDEEGAEVVGAGNPNYIPKRYQGFNRYSQNICRMKLHFSGYRNFSGTTCANQVMGLMINQNCNPFNYILSYFTANNSIGVDSDINIHMTGFMKPNISKSSKIVFSDIKLDSTGIALVEIPEFEPADQNRGNAVGGLLCYDKDYNKLNSTALYDLLSDFTYNAGSANRTSLNLDIENCSYFNLGDTEVSVAGLVPGNYYFFKPFVIREFTSGLAGENKLTYSSNVDMSISTAFVPTEAQVYSYKNGWLIDKFLRPEIGPRNLAMNTCSNQKQNLTLIGISRLTSKSLINTNVFNYIIKDPDNSDGYPNEGVGAITHWLSDSAYDIGSSISLYNGQVVPGFPNFNLNVSDGMSEQYKAVYHLTCNNSPDCQMLYKLVGGDPGEGIFYEGVFYTSADAVNATARCYSELLCPTNPNISINSINCIAP